MSHATSTHPATPATHAMAAAPGTTAAAPLKPVLFDDIEPVYLVRLFPKEAAAGNSAARAAALKQGEETMAAGLKLEAAAQAAVPEASTAG